MPRGMLKIGETLRLRNRFFPGHPNMRMGDHTSCMVDLPAGSLATVLSTHGSDILFSINPNPHNPFQPRTEVWMTLHMVDVMFESGGALPAVQRSPLPGRG